MRKFQDKRFVLFGDYPLSGGWGGYCQVYTFKRNAKLAAYDWLKLGYNAHLLDQKTGKQWEIRLRTNALGYVSPHDWTGKR